MREHRQDATRQQRLPEVQVETAWKSINVHAHRECSLPRKMRLNHSRFDLGFYAGRIYSLCAASSVLVITTLENIDLYARVVQALESERIEPQRVQLRTVQLNEAVVATRHIAADARPLVLDDLGSIPLPDTRNTTDRIRR